jgi:hypothetical protein
LIGGNICGLVLPMECAEPTIAVGGVDGRRRLGNVVGGEIDDECILLICDETRKWKLWMSWRLLSPMLSQSNYCNNERRHVSLSCDSKAMRVKH